MPRESFFFFFLSTVIKKLVTIEGMTYAVIYREILEENLR